MTVEASSVRNPAPRTMPGRENWWVEPTVYFVVLLAFVIYSFWSVVFGNVGGHWKVGPYLSPFYSPEIRPSWWPLSPAIFVAIFPLGFRATCYYYRKAYYRSFFWHPPACAIRELHTDPHYNGERKFPFVLNNFHRYFLYFAVIILIILWYDAIRGFYFHGGLYLGIGSVLMLVNVVLLTGYTASCHALRHLAGGSIDCYSCSALGKTRHGLSGALSRINPFHGNFAWLSLFSVAAVDIYIRLVSAGVFGATCLSGHVGC